MTELVDPLKFKAYGVKKPMDEKQEKINNLLEQNKRYYPTDPKGNVDEWGAVIKKQVETYELAKQHQEQMRMNQIKEYGLQLDIELQNNDQKKKMVQMERQSDREQMLRDQQMRDMVEQQLKEQEKQRKMQIGDQMKSAIDYKQRILAEERKKEQLQDYESVMNAKRDLDISRQAELEKRMLNQNMISQNLDQSRKYKLMKEQEDKAKELLDEEKAKSSYTYFNAHNQRQQEVQNRQKQFDEFQSRVSKQYLDAVASPQSEKMAKLYVQQMKDEQELQTKNTQDVQRGEIHKRQVQQANGQQLQMQLQQNAMIKNMNGNDLSSSEMIRKVNVQQQIQEEEANKRKEQQMKYRELLDQQMQLRTQMKMHGNMTNVEKQLNRDDLLAWKNYDNKQYSMIPGISSQKKMLDREKFGVVNPQYASQVSIDKMGGAQSNSNLNKYSEKQDRMKLYGFSRDPRDAANIQNSKTAMQNNITLLSDNQSRLNQSFANGPYADQSRDLQMRASTLAMNRSVDAIDQRSNYENLEQPPIQPISQEYMLINDNNRNRSPIVPYLKANILGSYPQQDYSNQRNPIDVYSGQAPPAGVGSLRHSANNISGKSNRDRSLLGQAGNSIFQ